MTPKTSLGFAFIEFARDVVGVELLPWQKWLAIHALELLPDGSFRFRTVVLLVARQNGKSTFLQLLALFFLYVRGVALVIGTAQNLDIAEEVWQGAVDFAKEVPELAAEVERVTMVNGKKALELRQGERYKVQAANRRGGRGLSGDLVMLDELREHQTWDAWAAVTKTTMARPLAQVWAVSNAGDASSVVLAHLRTLAHRALGDPDGLVVDGSGDEEVEVNSLGLFEWSAPAGCDLNDQGGWVWANPSLGHTIKERTIRDSIAVDPEPVTRTEVLCQWVERLHPAIFDLEWWSNRLADAKADRGADVVFGVDIGADRLAHVAVVWKRPDRKVQVMLAETGLSPLATSGRIADLAERWKGPVMLGGPSASLEADVPGSVVVSSSEFAEACGRMDDLVRGDDLRHGNQPALNEAVRQARWRPYGTAGERALQLNEAPAVGPLAAVVRAIHGLFNVKPLPPPAKPQMGSTSRRVSRDVDVSTVSF